MNNPTIEKYWCCLASVESESYEPIRPWQGILRNIQRPGGEILIMYRFKENDEIIDDPNSYAIVKNCDRICSSQSEANKHYISLCLQRIGELVENVQFYGNEIGWATFLVETKETQ